MKIKWKVSVYRYTAAIQQVAETKNKRPNYFSDVNNNLTKAI